MAARTVEMIKADFDVDINCARIHIKESFAENGAINVYYLDRGEFEAFRKQINIVQDLFDNRLEDLIGNNNETS